jgi:hypothetical protein
MRSHRREEDPRWGRRLAVAFGGALGSVLLHSLLLVPLLIGSGHERRPMPNNEGAASSGAPAMTVVFLHPADELSALTREARNRPDPVLAPISMRVPVGAIRIEEEHPADVAIDDPREIPLDREAALGDQGGRALLFGRYLGQITARIARAWLRPRTPIGAETFSCWVDVEQDARGNVREITLKRCNGTTAWQLSLVRAIESASPLPAPPDPSVFSRALTFEMTSEAFVAGGSANGFEPDSLVFSAR